MSNKSHQNLIKTISTYLCGPTPCAKHGVEAIDIVGFIIEAAKQYETVEEVVDGLTAEIARVLDEV